MANTSQLARQVQELRELIEARNAADTAAIYAREAPEGVDPKRVVLIKRVLIDPPEQPAEKLPEILESSPAIERAAPPSFQRKLEEPKLGIV